MVHPTTTSTNFELSTSTALSLHCHLLSLPPPELIATRNHPQPPSQSHHRSSVLLGTSCMCEGPRGVRFAGRKKVTTASADVEDLLPQHNAVEVVLDARAGHTVRASPIPCLFHDV